MADKLVETDVEKAKPLLARGKDGVRRGTIGGVKVSLGRSGKSNGGARLFRAGSKMTYLDKPYADGGNSGRNQTRRNIKSYLASLKKSNDAPSALATLDAAIEKARGKGLLRSGATMASMAPKLRNAIAQTRAANRGANPKNSEKISRRSHAYKRLLRTRPNIARAERERQSY